MVRAWNKPWDEEVLFQLVDVSYDDVVVVVVVVVRRRRMWRLVDDWV
jgi:hypothetical protein